MHRVWARSTGTVLLHPAIAGGVQQDSTASNQPASFISLIRTLQPAQTTAHCKVGTSTDLPQHAKHTSHLRRRLFEGRKSVATHGPPRPFVSRGCRSHRLRLRLARAMSCPPLAHATHQYGGHSLQRVDVWHFQQPEREHRGRWIMYAGHPNHTMPCPSDRSPLLPAKAHVSLRIRSYIHGGAWRDPRITAQCFVPSMQQTMASARVADSAVRGFASIDYRLSPHADFPQDPGTTPPSELRCARHPDHIQDVESALVMLDENYGIGNDYVLIGHSAGAALAFQLLMRRHDEEHNRRVPLPAAIIGLAGIYDLAGIDRRHDGGYTGFIAAAFGDDADAWRCASPAFFQGNYRDVWGAQGFALLAWSCDDTLVDKPEIDLMEARLLADGLSDTRRVDLARGDHDFAWEDGSQVADLVATALEEMTLPQVREGERGPRGGQS